LLIHRQLTKHKADIEL